MSFSFITCGTELIKIGVSLPLTGASKQLGESLMAGIKPAINDINQNGGVNGKQLRLFILDDAYNPEKTVKNTIQFIESNRVDILFSYVGTPTMHQLSPLLFKYEIPVFFPITGAHIFYKDHYKNYVIHSRPSYWDEAASMIQFFKKKHVNKLSVYYQKDAFGKSGLMGVEQQRIRHKLPPINSVSYKRGKSISDRFDSDSAVLLETDPDAIILISSYSASAGIIKEIRKTSQIPIIAISFSDPIEMIQLIKDNPKNLVNLYYSNILPNKKTRIETYHRITGLAYNPISFEGFINTYYLKEILEDYTGPFNTFTQSDFQYSPEYYQPVIQKYSVDGWVDQ